MKKIILFIIFFHIILLVLTVKTNNIPIQYDEINDSTVINYKDINKNEIVKLELEDYVIGVVAAEMPASFELEALKAQTLAARTYSLKNKAFITNDINCDQAFITEDEMKKRWGKNFEKNYNKIKQAILETKGKIIVFDDELIDAVYHSTSAGKTQNAEDVWKYSHPYLKSVMSALDSKSPSYNAEYKVSEKKLLDIVTNFFKLKDKKISIKIKERYDTGYVKTILINKTEVKGTELRKILNLRSNNFDIEKKGSDYIFRTKGYGHGVGMSQYGANFLAKEGMKYDEIIKHYYTGVEIKQITDVIDNKEK
ncbi:MAG TPA: stage II sporulation protein D [Clostridiales bacterium]|nr:MAG: stage II sporulation protein D [Clostridiales bacterium GWD2_32_19]HCC06682.1 stage II sporulation protein D [Clostridiales bacterium]